VPAKDLHKYFFPRLFSPKSIREVIEILDRLAIELRQDIAALQAGFGSGRTRANIGKSNAIGHLGEIGNAAEIGAIAGSSRTGMWVVLGWRRGLRDPNELRPRRAVRQVIGYVGHQIQEADRIG